MMTIQSKKKIGRKEMMLYQADHDEYMCVSNYLSLK